jgi:hypothetical protein
MAARDGPDDLGAPFGEGAQFSVRTLEKGAHLRRNRRGFPRCALSKTSAHLRIGCAPSKQGVALGYPLAGAVPLARKVVQTLASASIALFGRNSFGSCVQLPLERPVEVGRAIPARRESRLHQETAGWNGFRLKQISAFAAGAYPTKPFQLHAGRARTEKRLRMSEIYSVWLYRCAFR